MNSITRYALKIGVTVQALTAGFFLCAVNPVTTMSAVCLCFILFAELEFFGTLAVLFQYAIDRVPAAVRVGISAVTTLYACGAIVAAVAFMPYDLSVVKGLFVIQLALLMAMVTFDAALVGISQLVRRRAARHKNE